MNRLKLNIDGHSPATGFEAADDTTAAERRENGNFPNSVIAGTGDWWPDIITVGAAQYKMRIRDIFRYIPQHPGAGGKLIDISAENSVKSAPNGSSRRPQIVITEYARSYFPIDPKLNDYLLFRLTGRPGGEITQTWDARRDEESEKSCRSGLLKGRYGYADVHVYRMTADIAPVINGEPDLASVKTYFNKVEIPYFGEVWFFD